MARTGVMPRTRPGPVSAALAAALALAGCIAPPGGGRWVPVEGPVAVRVAMPAAAVAPGDGPLCAEARRELARQLRRGLPRRGVAVTAEEGAAAGGTLEVTGERCAVVASLWDGPGMAEGAGVSCYHALWVRARFRDGSGRVLWERRFRTYEHLEDEDPLPVIATDLTFREPVDRVLVHFRAGRVWTAAGEAAR